MISSDLASFPTVLENIAWIRNFSLADGQLVRELILFLMHLEICFLLMSILFEISMHKIHSLIGLLAKICVVFSVNLQHHHFGCCQIAQALVRVIYWYPLSGPRMPTPCFA